jgi:hypothetical protein
MRHPFGVLSIRRKHMASSSVPRLPILLGVLVTFSIPTLAQSFVHPGLLHTRADFERMKSMVAAGAEPYKQGFDAFAAHAGSRPDYTVRGGFAEMGRNPEVNMGESVSDCNAAYHNAVMWAITGNRAHADKAIQILDTWSANLATISGKDAILAAGIYGFKFVNAAEILRHSRTGWPQADIERAERMFKDVFYPVIKDFATFANGNWELAALQTMMGIGIFTNDTAIYNRAVDWYYNGTHNGTLTHYIVNEEGQCQESGRDQTHTMLGLGMLAAVAEMGWNQGLDMYGAVDNRLLKGFEYTARYNLGEAVPFQEYTDKTGKYHHDSISSHTRGAFRPIFEQVYHHYANRRGLPPSAFAYTKRVADSLRPERDAAQADNIGYGTLLFTRPFGIVGVGVREPGGIVPLPERRRVTVAILRGQGHQAAARALDILGREPGVASLIGQGARPRRLSASHGAHVLIPPDPREGR